MVKHYESLDLNSVREHIKRRILSFNAYVLSSESGVKTKMSLEEMCEQYPELWHEFLGLALEGSISNNFLAKDITLYELYERLMVTASGFTGAIGTVLDKLLQTISNEELALLEEYFRAREMTSRFSGVLVEKLKHNLLNSGSDHIRSEDFDRICMGTFRELVETERVKMYLKAFSKIGLRVSLPLHVEGEYRHESSQQFLIKQMKDAVGTLVETVTEPFEDLECGRNGYNISVRNLLPGITNPKSSTYGISLRKEFELPNHVVLTISIELGEDLTPTPELSCPANNHSAKFFRWMDEHFTVIVFDELPGFRRKSLEP